MMKLKAVKDSIGGYRVAGTEVIWARENFCRCCWYVWDIEETEVIDSGLSYARAKEVAFKYVQEKELQDA
jgi:hypothetical protein